VLRHAFDLQSCAHIFNNLILSFYFNMDLVLLDRKHFLYQLSQDEHKNIDG